MRTIPSPELALWTDGDQSVRELRVRVKRPGDASWTNLSATTGGDWVLGIRTQGDTPDQPAGQFTVQFLKHATEGSVSPGLSAEPLNIDAASAFRPILHPGRSIEVDVRIDAEPWRLWLQGQIEDIEWGGNDVVATCLTLDGVILATQIEEENPSGAPDPGTPVEDEIQDLLDEWMTSPPTLRVIGTPDWGVGEYTPPLGSLGELLRTHAQRNGWDLRYRWYETDSNFRYTLYLPDRDKTVADFPLGLELMNEVAGLKISRQWVRNAIIVEYANSAGVPQTPVTVTDSTSITEYGRRAMVIRELSADSPIKDSTAATALATYAKKDLATPLADARYRIPFLPWLELHDLIAIQADDDNYDYDTDFAVVSVSHGVEPTGGWWTEVELRGGKPAGSFYSWHARTPAVPAAEAGVVDMPPTLEITTESESGAVGTFGVTVRDPNGFATALHVQKKSGMAPWGSWTLEDATPNDGVEYTETVSLIEDHQSYIRYRLAATVNGEDLLIYEESGGLDIGSIPNIAVRVVVNQTTGAAYLEWSGDRDTGSVKAALSTSGTPSDSTVRAATAINGRSGLTPELTGLTAGQTVYGAAFGYSELGGGGNESTAKMTAKDTYGITAAALPTYPASQVTGLPSGTTLEAASLSFGTTGLVWSATDVNTVAWTSGTLYLSDGTSYAVSAGNTGDMSAGTTVYWDSASPTAYQITTSQATATGSTKIIVGIAGPATNSAWKAWYIPVEGMVGISGDNIQANSVTAGHIKTGEVNANHITSISLTVLQATVTGDLSVLGNGNFAGNLSGANITGASGTFGGTVALESGSNKISFRSGGTEDAALVSVTGTAKLTTTGGDVWLGNSSNFFVYKNATFSDDVNLSSGKKVSLGTWFLYQFVNNNLHFDYSGSGTQYYFQPDGSAFANTSWGTFSPKPPKPAAEMTADDNLAWAAEDAEKPEKEYEGIPTPDHPFVKSEATRLKRSKAEISAREIAKYSKDPTKIAMGVTRWARMFVPEVRARFDAHEARIAELEATVARLAAKLDKGP